MHTERVQQTIQRTGAWRRARRRIDVSKRRDAPNLTALSLADHREPDPPKRLLGVWSHPDDEAYLAAGLMARIIDQGGDVTIVTLTDGEAGFPDDDLRPATERAAQRRAEMRSAMRVIGITDVRFVGLPDGALAQADPSFPRQIIRDVIEDVDPDVIVTFGPDGITGHEDHIANGRLATQAWMECGERAELWYAAKSNDWLDTWSELHHKFDVLMTDNPLGVPSEDIAYVVDMTGAELRRKRAVLAEHHSQTAGLVAAFGERRYCEWVSQEAFRQPTRAELAQVMLQRSGTLAVAR